MEDRRPSTRSARSRLAVVGLAVGLGAMAACATLDTREVVPPRDPDVLVGMASWYGPRHHGRTTASGQPFDMHALVAAHRTLPLGSRVRVTNLDNGRSVVVRIVDRGPYVAGRLLDLSQAAAEALDMVDRGIARVQLEVLPDAD
jgi:rare lipoprotein A